jgi:uncharacterized protein YjiS (DUF1127 family)
MRKSTDLDSFAALEEVAPHGVITCSDTPIVILRHGPACNDATSENPAISKDQIEPWAQHALAANGFGDAATTGTASSARPTSDQVYQAARALRSFTLGAIIVAMIQAAATSVRRAYARYRQRREIDAIYDLLRQIDDRTLRDIGFHRSELRSVAAELSGETECTRVRTSRSSERWSSVSPPKTANSTIYPQEQNEKIRMHRYETSTPRVAFAIAAVAMTVITVGVLVVMPAKLNTDDHEPSRLAASKVATLASTSAVSGAAIDVVSLHVPGLATAQYRRQVPNSNRGRGAEFPRIPHLPRPDEQDFPRARCREAGCFHPGLAGAHGEPQPLERPHADATERVPDVVIERK